ncbi:MAG: LacI family DNA-binding transcriptional regulator [Hamadaea sp.]|nr:LacI family DNA-binding transcriptional regulator [Hamadaea sp.]
MVPRPTLQTVADAVGVSRSTVSNAYSRPDQLSPELRDRILSAAERLGYAGPHAGARSLRTGSVGAIGVLFTDDLVKAFTDPFAVQFLSGLAASAQRHDVGVLLLPLSSRDERDAEETVRNAVVDGFCSYCVPDWHTSWKAVAARGLPMVAAESRGQQGPGLFFVGVDEAKATRSAGEHIARLGHRRIAIIGEWLKAEREAVSVTLDGPDDIPYYVSRERLRGYWQAFEAAGIRWQDILTINVSGNSKAEGAASAAYALDRADRPTAILALTDLQALGVMDALRQRGLEPGRDVSVVGFDDLPEAGAAGLTTIRQPAQERGRLAGELLLDPSARPADGQVVLPTELIVRASTGPVPTRSM